MTDRTPAFTFPHTGKEAGGRLGRRRFGTVPQSRRSKRNDGRFTVVTVEPAAVVRPAHQPPVEG
ncbi:MAG: hypothetical protein LBS86_03725, partial [Treponema sp.]|nr:hypothetical protein [Treponema sp.]